LFEFVDPLIHSGKLNMIWYNTFNCNWVDTCGSSRSRLRWEDDVKADLGTMKIHNWKKMAMAREARNRMIEQVKTHKDL